MQEERLCVLCPRSVHRRRQNHVLQASLLHTHPAHVSYIQENAIRQVSFNSTQSVCHRCWQRVDHSVLNPVQNPAEHEPEVPPPVPVPVPVPPLQNDVQGSNDGELYVPSYKRAPNTSSHCIFGACSNDNRRRIPKTIKLYMMTTHQLYIPQHARVCRDHLESNMWDELENHCTISHYFTAEHFTDVCNIFTEGIITNKQYDFETMVGLKTTVFIFGLDSMEVSFAPYYCKHHRYVHTAIIEPYSVFTSLSYGLVRAMKGLRTYLKCLDEH